MKYFEVILEAGAKTEEQLKILRDNWCRDSFFDDFNKPIDARSFYNRDFNTPSLWPNILLMAFASFYFKKPINDEDGPSIEISLFQNALISKNGHIKYSNQLKWKNGDILMGPEIYLLCDIANSSGKVFFEIPPRSIDCKTPEILKIELRNELKSTLTTLLKQKSLVINEIKKTREGIQT